MKGKNNTIYICHLCKFKTNDSSNLVTHLKHTNHNIKKSIKKNAFNCLSKKKKFQIVESKSVCQIVHIEETNNYENILDEFQNLKLKT